MNAWIGGRHVLDRVDESREQERRQKRAQHAHLIGQQLRSSSTADRRIPRTARRTETGSCEATAAARCPATARRRRTCRRDRRSTMSTMPTTKYAEHLAEHQLRRPHRRRKQLLHRAHLPFARDRQRGQQRRDDHEDDRDQSRHDVVLRFERLLYQTRDARLDRRPSSRPASLRSAARGSQLERVDLDQPFGIASAMDGRVRIAAVDSNCTSASRPASRFFPSRSRGITTASSASLRSIRRSTCLSLSA